MFAEEILKEVYPYFQYASLIVALVYYKKYKQYSFYKFFIIYLTNLIVFHVLSSTIDFEDGNIAFLNIYTFFEFNFFVLIYYHLIKEKPILIVVKRLALIFNIIYFLSFIYGDLAKYTVSLEGFFNSIFVLMYFRELLNSEKILNFKKLLPFWVSVGFLLFYLVSIPFFTLLYSKHFSTRIMFPILYYSIIVFHLCFIYGLVTCKKKIT